MLFVNIFLQFLCDKLFCVFSFSSFCANASLTRTWSSRRPSTTRTRIRCGCSRSAGTKTGRCTGSSWIRTTTCVFTLRSRTTWTAPPGSASSGERRDETWWSCWEIKWEYKEKRLKKCFLSPADLQISWVEWVKPFLFV